MKDFDAERTTREDRSFRIGGYDFVFKKAVQEDIACAYWDAMGPEIPNAVLLQAMDNLIEAGLEENCRANWKVVRSADAEVPLMGKDIHELISYMFEVMLDRPTVNPSGSTVTPAPSGTSSTERPLSAVAT